MKKIIYLLIIPLIIISCNNGSNKHGETDTSQENSVSLDYSNEMDEVEMKVLEVIKRVDNIFNDAKKTNTTIAEIEKSIEDFQKGSKEYIKAKGDLKAALKTHQDIIDKINEKYSHYLGYELGVYTVNDLLDSACERIKAAIRAEMYKEYYNSKYY